MVRPVLSPFFRSVLPGPSIPRVAGFARYTVTHRLMAAFEKHSAWNGWWAAPRVSEKEEGAVRLEQMDRLSKGAFCPTEDIAFAKPKGISPALATSVCRRSLLNALLTADLLNFYRGSMLRMPTPSASEALGTNERVPLVRAIDGNTLVITDRRNGRRTDLPSIRRSLVSVHRRLHCDGRR
jgi:hypothetical protein